MTHETLTLAAALHGVDVDAFPCLRVESTHGHRFECDAVTLRHDDEAEHARQYEDENLHEGGARGDFTATLTRRWNGAAVCRAVGFFSHGPFRREDIDPAAPVTLDAWGGYVVEMENGERVTFTPETVPDVTA